IMNFSTSPSDKFRIAHLTRDLDVARRIIEMAHLDLNATQEELHKAHENLNESTKIRQEQEEKIRSLTMVCALLAFAMLLALVILIAWAVTRLYLNRLQTHSNASMPPNIDPPALNQAHSSSISSSISLLPQQVQTP